MRVGILLCDTDNTILSQKYPDDGQKFRTLMARQRPDWAYETVPVKDNVFPRSVDAHDGYVITGSPSSVNDHDPWITGLMAFIRELDSKRIPTVGACFGHQAIAAALGGQVGKNPAGWGLGIAPTTFHHHLDWMDPAHEKLDLYTAHNEQVLELPDRARVLGSSPIAPVGSFAIENHIFTTQHHPEITADYMDDLVNVVAGIAPKETIDQAYASMRGMHEGDRFAGWMVQFLEMAPLTDRPPTGSIE